jgi:tetratricopeptide (TPR) repeat protein
MAMKRLLLIILLASIILSACSQGSEENSLISELVGTSVPPTPTVTPTPQPKARISLGEEHILAGDYEAALNEFWTARAQSTDPEIIAAAQLGVGRVLYLQAKNSSAVEQLNWLLTNVPEGEIRNTAFFYLAKAYEKLGQYGPAAEAYGNYLRLEPGPLDSEIYEMQGDAYRTSGRRACLVIQIFLT